MEGFRRAVIVAVLSALAVSVTSAGVLAAAPDRSPALPIPPPVTGQFCGPAMGDVTASVDIATYNNYQKVFTFKSGVVIVLYTGHQSATVVGNGKTLHFNVSGPARITINPDGTLASVIGEGPLFYIGPPGTPQPGMRIYYGRTVIDVSDPNNATIASYTGNVTDVCVLLAA